MSIAIHEIASFKTPIFAGTLPTEVTNNVVDNIRQIRDNNKGMSLSNAGGWQSISYPHNSNNFMIPLVDAMTEIINNISNKFNITDSLRLTNYWFNINKKYNYNMSHTHPGCQFSAIVYLKCPNNSGHLVLERSDAFADYMVCNFNGINQYNSESWKMSPQKNMFIVFPSYVPHYVNQNLTEELDDERISVAFNFSR